jgi:hypothetical protein
MVVNLLGQDISAILPPIICVVRIILLMFMNYYKKLSADGSTSTGIMAEEFD